MSTVAAEGGTMGPVPAHPAPGPLLRKDPSMLPTRPSAGRALLTGLLAVFVAAGVAGCSTLEKVKTAAIVDGDRITTDEVVTTTQQFNAYLTPLFTKGQKVPEQTIVAQLVLAHFVNAWVAEHGGFKGDPQYAAALASVPDASPGTKTFLQSNSSLQTIPQEGQTQIVASVHKAKIEVNPRYGSLDPTAAFALKMQTPNWIKPGSPDPAATATAPPQQ